MVLALVVALAKHKGIGNKNRLPWHPQSLSADMCWFRTLTQSMLSPVDGLPLPQPASNIVVMGRKTWDSIPARFRPLPKRLNVVLSRTARDNTENTMFIPSFGDTRQLKRVCMDGATMFVIGGHDVYGLAMMSGDVRLIFATEVLGELECDVFFPSIDWSLYTKRDITKKVSETIDAKIVSRCYDEGSNVFEEHGIRFKMFLYSICEYVQA